MNNYIFNILFSYYDYDVAASTNTVVNTFDLIHTQIGKQDWLSQLSNQES